MKSITKLVTLVFVLASLHGCANLKGASKSSTSLTNFLGFTELPDWYITERYDYLDSQWVENDFGHRIHYRDIGEGPVVVLVHGELSSLHTWDAWIEGLTEEYRVIAIDLPGSGLTGAPHCVSDPMDTCPENLSHEYIQHSLKYFIEDLKLSSFALVGSSYGGYLALNYALEHPEKINHLALINPMGFQQPLPSMVSYLTTPPTSYINFLVQPASVITTVVEDFYGTSNKVTQDNVGRYIDLAQSDGAHYSNIKQLQIVRGLMENGTTSKISEVSVPTMILWGEMSKWGSSEHAEVWSEEIKDSVLVKYSNLGHVPMEEDPEVTLADFVAFMKGEDIPTIIGLGSGGTFSIDDALKAFSKESVFGTSEDYDVDPEESIMEEMP